MEGGSSEYFWVCDSCTSQDMNHFDGVIDVGGGGRVFSALVPVLASCKQQCFGYCFHLPCPITISISRRSEAIHMMNDDYQGLKGLGLP